MVSVKSHHPHVILDIPIHLPRNAEIFVKTFPGSISRMQRMCDHFLTTEHLDPHLVSLIFGYTVMDYALFAQ